MTDRTLNAKAVTGPDGEIAPSQRPAPLRALPDCGDVAGQVEMATMRHRLKELESENLALRTKVNRLVVSLSRTLLRDAAS